MAARSTRINTLTEVASCEIAKSTRINALTEVASCEITTQPVITVCNNSCERPLIRAGLLADKVFAHNGTPVFFFFSARGPMSPPYCAFGSADCNEPVHHEERVSADAKQFYCPKEMISCTVNCFIELKGDQTCTLTFHSAPLLEIFLPPVRCSKPQADIGHHLGMRCCPDMWLLQVVTTTRNF